MNLFELGRYKQTLLEKIHKSKDIIDAILPSGYSPYDVTDLLKEHLFSFLFVEGTQKEEKSYICLDTRVPRVIDHTYKDVQIIIQVIAHKNILDYEKIGYLGNRVDIVSDMVDRLINNSDLFGSTRLQLNGVEIYNTEKYYGKTLMYSCVDFNSIKKIR